MNRYSLTHLSDSSLVRGLKDAVAHESSATAVVLAHVAEVDARKLFLPAGYSSMFAYCLGELRLSEDATYKRIQAARAARRFPEIFDAVADGRLHLAGVCLLAPQLTPETGRELLAAAAHKSKAEIEQLLARRFPQPDMATRLRALPASRSDADRLAPGQVERRVPLVPAVAEAKPMVGALPATQLAPGQVAAPRPRVTPLAPERYALQVTIPQATHDKLRRAQQLLSHAVAPGDVAEVLDRALDALIAQLEKRKLGATTTPRKPRPCKSERTIPAHVRRAVWARDGGQCTFVSASGHRCEERNRLEFDHAHEVARGGRASIGLIRLRCRAHNQYAAERTFGVELMREKRRAASDARAGLGRHGGRPTTGSRNEHARPGGPPSLASAVPDGASDGTIPPPATS